MRGSLGAVCEGVSALHERHDGSYCMNDCSLVLCGTERPAKHTSSDSCIMFAPLLEAVHARMASVSCTHHAAPAKFVRLAHDDAELRRARRHPAFHAPPSEGDGEGGRTEP